MIDKVLVKQRFEKSLKTYDENAVIQKIMAKNLIGFLYKNKFNSIFEIGCATGILTSEIKKHIEFKEYFANDIVEKSKEYFQKIIPFGIFYAGDIERIKLQGKYDLIISNACIQWCSDIENTMDKLYSSLKQGGILAVSVFGDENLKEIRTIFDIPHNIYGIKQLKSCLSKYKLRVFKEDINKIPFDTPFDILRHLKYTGANAIQNYPLTKLKLKNFEIKYKELYQKGEKVYLTYNPVYIILEKFYDI